MASSLIIAVVLSLFICKTEGYASYFASSSYCGVTLAIGESLMGATVQSGNSRTIVVKRGSTILSNGDYYVAGESLKVSVSSSASEWAFQVTDGDATFTNGACSKKRYADGSPTLVMPSSGSVTLNGGSAQSQGTVLMFSDFVLNCCLSPTVIPTVKPTIGPTTSPSVIPSTAPTTSTPSIVPTASPSVIPSIVPSQSPTVIPTTSLPTTISPTTALTEPSYLPTFLPSIKPSVVPSIKPSCLPTVIPSIQPSVVPTIKPTFIVTGKPSVPPTFVPTFIVETLVTYEVSQVVHNISTTVLGSSVVKTAFIDTLTESLKFFSSPRQVTIVSVSDASRRLLIDADSRVKQGPTSSSSRQLSTTHSVSIVYGVSYVLEGTSYTNSEDLSVSLTSAINLISNSPLFINTLQSQGVAAVSGVTSTSAEGISLGVTVISRSALPSVTPSKSPSSASGEGISTTDDDLYNGSLVIKVVVGVVVGFLSLVAIVLVCRSYMNNYKVVLSTSSQYLTYPSVMAVVCGFIAIILVSAWATDVNPDATDQQYLGAPSWETNVFAWHPVLMVAGFYCAQVKAVNDWNLFSSHKNAKISHVLFQTAALCCLIAGMCAIVKHNFKYKTPALNTMHSWMGVAAIVLFGWNYSLGAFMGYLTAMHPSSMFRVAFDLRRIHQVIGLCSLGMTTLAIISGIMDKLPQGSCFYHTSGGSIAEVDVDPAENYMFVPTSCRIAHGLGVVVVIGSFLTAISVKIRAEAASASHYDELKSGKVKPIKEVYGNGTDSRELNVVP